MQGANDPRVKKAEADQIVVALRDLKIPVEYMVAMDEGHGFRNPENNLAMFAYSEKFLAKHLGGRYQEAISPEISKRLATLMVDINTVKDPIKEAQKATAPTYLSDLKPENSKYNFTFSFGGQNMAMDMTREVKMENGKWKVTDFVTSPQITVSDVNIIEPKTLKHIHRSTKQGPATVEIDYTAEGAKGTMDAGNGGAKVPISSKLEPHVIGDGAGLDLLIARMPLKEDYSTVIEVYDGSQNKVKKLQVKVLGKETVTVPAGSFESFKVEVAQLDGPEKFIAWISTKDLNMVRTEANVPQMGDAHMVAELK